MKIEPKIVEIYLDKNDKRTKEEVYAEAHYYNMIFKTRYGLEDDFEHLKPAHLKD